MTIGNGVNRSERIRRVEQNHLSLHLVLKALIDVQTNRSSLVILVNTFFNTDRRITMLFYTFQCGAQSLEPKL